MPATEFQTFAELCGAQFPKAVKKITDDQTEVMEFYDLPAEHWIHRRTTNPIESTFATVWLRTEVTRGAGSRTAALAKVFKLIESVQARRRAVKQPTVALVRAGAPLRMWSAHRTPPAPGGMNQPADPQELAITLPPAAVRKCSGFRWHGRAS